MVNNTYTLTVKVLVDCATDAYKRGFVEQNLFTVWIYWEEAERI
jgi:hypothetical protein